MAKELLDKKELQEFLGISPMTVFRWRKKGLLKPHHMGGKVYFLKAEVLRTIQSNPGNPEK